MMGSQEKLAALLGAGRQSRTRYCKERFGQQVGTGNSCVAGLLGGGSICSLTAWEANTDRKTAAKRNAMEKWNDAA